MEWFSKDEEKKEAAAPERRVFRFEDFINPTPELPEDMPRIDVLEKEISDLRVRVNELESLKASVAYTEQGIEDWFRKHIAKLADDAAKEFVQRRNAQIFLTALEKAEISKQIQEAVQQAAGDVFNSDKAKEFGVELGKALFHAVSKKLGYRW